ncbi:DinB family protein [Moheibacter stercoris]|uniref:Damage-inducible protein DinB n=1 Tax=Moheibacter stercoris TaxID=1628251 RepID=A0ABV2LVC0_9FLAO
MNTTANSNILSSGDLLKNWQANRGLTRRVIEAFPEKELFEFSIAGMRPFSEMTKELLAIAGPGLDQIVNGSDQILDEERTEWNSKEALLKAWDETTELINSLWSKMEDSKFEERIKLFGQYENTVFDSITYFVENEIHHRGQGYVYLRAIGIEPPFFWEK